MILVLGLIEVVGIVSGGRVILRLILSSRTILRLRILIMAMLNREFLADLFD